MPDAIERMTQGASSFPGSFFSDLGKANGGKPPGAVVKRQSASASALTEMLIGAATLAPKWISGDQDGVKKAITQMTQGAAAFGSGFLSDVGDATQ